MKIPKARKLPSGRWQCRVTIGGKQMSIVRDTKKQAEKEAAALKSGVQQIPVTEMTVSEAMEAYISEKQDRLSPSTIKGYRAIQAHRFEQLRHQPVSRITRAQWQEAIDQEAEKYSPKTIKNEWRFMSSVLRAQGIQPPKITLDKVIPPDLMFLTYEQIPVFCEAIKGTDYEIAALLALSSLRVSEILNVTREKVDLERGCIYVHGAAVIDEHGDLIHKAENKNRTSRRTIPFILPQLREAIERGNFEPGDYLVRCHPNSLWKAMNRICRNAGLPAIGMHDLRRTFVSLAVHQGLGLEQIRKIGGWSNDTTIRAVYLKIADKDMESAGELFTDFFK